MQQREMFEMGTSTCIQMLSNYLADLFLYSPIPHTTENLPGQTAWPKPREKGNTEEAVHPWKNKKKLQRILRRKFKY